MRNVWFHAPAGVLTVAIALGMPARAAGTSENGEARSVRSFELPAADEAQPDLFTPDPLGISPAPLWVEAPEPEEAPVVVPLPPALGTGLAGLATLAAVRVARRVYRRR